MAILRVFRPLAVFTGFAQQDEDTAMEQFCIAEHETCHHCGQEKSGSFQSLILYFVLGIVASVCFHSAHL